MCLYRQRDKVTFLFPGIQFYQSISFGEHNLIVHEEDLRLLPIEIPADYSIHHQR